MPELPGTAFATVLSRRFTLYVLLHNRSTPAGVIIAGKAARPRELFGCHERSDEFEDLIVGLLDEVVNNRPARE